MLSTKTPSFKQHRRRYYQFFIDYFSSKNLAQIFQVCQELQEALVES